MSELGHESKRVVQDQWGDLEVDRATAALEQAAAAAPPPEQAETVHRALLWVWRVAANGKALEKVIPFLSKHEREIAEQTALDAAYGQLEALRQGTKRRRTSLLNNLINVMSYAVKRSVGLYGRGDPVIRTSGTRSTKRGTRSFEGAVSVFDQEDNWHDEDWYSAREWARQRFAYVVSLERRFADALGAGLVAPLGSTDFIGRQFAIRRYHYKQYGIEQHPAIDHSEMETRLAFADVAVEVRRAHHPSRRGELKRQAEKAGGTPDEIRRRYNRLRRREHRARQAAGRVTLLTGAERAAIERTVSQREFPVRARRALGGSRLEDEGATGAWRRANDSLRDSIRAAEEAGSQFAQSVPPTPAEAKK